MEVAYLTLFSIAFLAATNHLFFSEVILVGLSATSGTENYFLKLLNILKSFVPPTTRNVEIKL